VPPNRMIVVNRRQI